MNGGIVTHHFLPGKGHDALPFDEKQAIINLGGSTVRVLVLGATGLLGNNILRAAIETGWEAIAFDWAGRRRRRRRHPALEGLPVTIAEGRPDDPTALRRAMKLSQVVFHTQGYSPPNSLRHQRRIEEAERHIGHVLRAADEATPDLLIYTGSVCTIGQPDVATRLPDEFNVYRRGSILHPYWDAKLVQEEAALAFGRRSKTAVIVLNQAQLIGPYDLGLEAAGPLIEMCRRGFRRFLPGRVSIADARDLAQAHIVAAERGRPGERYVVAGHNLTRHEMLSRMAHACKRSPPNNPIQLDSYERLTRISERLSCLGRPNRQFTLSFEVAAARYCGWYDSAKARDELNFDNRPLANTFRATLAWLEQAGLLK